MKGTASVEATQIYRSILDYYMSIGPEDITEEQTIKWEKLLSDGVLLCDDSLDKALLSLQAEYIRAEGDSELQSLILQRVLQIL